MPQALYLDACCLNRPFDDQRQPRVHLESEAVLDILKLVRLEVVHLVGSDAIQLELDHCVDPSRRERLAALVELSDSNVPLSPSVIRRGKQLEELGFKAMDALHLASAENGGADWLLTTDDRLLNKSRRQQRKLTLRVANPTEWMIAFSHED